VEIFGEIERVLSELYPYRVPLTLGGVVAGALAVWVVVRLGWHRSVLDVAGRHRLASAVVGVAALVVAVPLGNYLVSPLWERSTLVEASPLERVVATSMPGAGEAPVVLASDDASAVVARGEFVGADEFHFGRGQALLIETTPGVYSLRFDEFSVRNGPDLFVYLSEDADGYGGDVLKLGRLKATDGSFNYEVPAGTDVSRFSSAVVWCDAFAVLFATASLE
jgi:hypothetical protein